MELLLPIPPPCTLLQQTLLSPTLRAECPCHLSRMPTGPSPLSPSAPAGGLPVAGRSPLQPPPASGRGGKHQEAWTAPRLVHDRGVQLISLGESVGAQALRPVALEALAVEHVLQRCLCPSGSQSSADRPARLPGGLLSGPFPRFLRIPTGQSHNTAAVSDRSRGHGVFLLCCPLFLATPVSFPKKTLMEALHQTLVRDFNPRRLVGPESRCRHRCTREPRTALWGVSRGQGHRVRVQNGRNITE